MRARLATPADASAIAGIYNQAIEDRTATFETELRTDEDIIAWFDNAHPIVVVVDDAGVSGEDVVGFARTSEYRPRECYSGVFEFGVFVDHNHRRRGAGTLAMRELITLARTAGAWKLVSRVFVENEKSRGLLTDLGFREVGTYHRHAKLDGKWRDVVIVEKFLAPIVIESVGRPAASGAGVASASVGVAVGLSPGRRASRDQILTSLKAAALQTRVQGLEHARAMIEAHQFPDPELLEAAADALFLVKVHDTTARSRFVDLFRTYASLSPEAARDLYDALFERIERLSIRLDLDAFYEALFIIKQVASATSTHPTITSHGANANGAARRPPELGTHVPRLLEWMKLVIELPQGMRTRISPGNVTSLLMNLALAGCDSDEQRKGVAELAAEAKARHRVEPPVSIRSSVPPPANMIDLPVIPPMPPLPEMRPHQKAETVPAIEDMGAPGAATVEVAAVRVDAVEQQEEEVEARAATPASPIEPITIEVSAIDAAKIEATATASAEAVEHIAPLVEAALVAPLVEAAAAAAPEAAVQAKEPEVPRREAVPEAPAPAAKKKRTRRAPAPKAQDVIAASAGGEQTAPPAKKKRASRAKKPKVSTPES